MTLCKGMMVACDHFRDGPEEVKRKTMEAKKMLDLWKSSYLEVRATIEASGRDSRWEFDRKRLFDRTDHMSLICQDLCSMAQVSRESEQMGPGEQGTRAL